MLMSTQSALIKSPINYMGSKFKMMNVLLDIFQPAETFVDLFAGGGSVYMNVSHLYSRILVNDSISDLIEIHRNLKDKQWVGVAVSRSIATINDSQKYEELRTEYNISKDPRLLLALIWSCNSNMMRFNSSGNFNQTWGKRGYNSDKHKIYRQYHSAVDISNVSFLNLSFEDVLIPDDSFVYIDPPYSNTRAGYNNQWNAKSDQRLIVYINDLHKRGIKFAISGVSNGEKNPVYDALIDKYNISYHGDLYQGIAKKTKTNTEYVIYNYDR